MAITNRLIVLTAVLVELASCKPATALPATPKPGPTQETVVSPTATPLATPTPQPRQVFQPFGPDLEHFPSGISPLTGQPLQDPSGLERPAVLVSISNMPVTARPQAGPGFAPWIFELFIGEGTTRFMGIFYGDLPRRVPDISGPCQVNAPPVISNSDWVGGSSWLDENQDGVQNPWEEGVGGVCVSLYSEDNDPLGQTSTASNGSYIFQTAPGKQYFIRFDAGPAYDFTLPDTGNDDQDSDANPQTGQTSAFSLQGGDHSWDAGLLLVNPPASTSTPIPEDIAPERTYVGPIRSGRLTYNAFHFMFPGSCLVFASAAEDILERLDYCEVVYGQKDAASVNTALLDASRMRELGEQRRIPGQVPNYSANYFDPAPLPDGHTALSLWTFYHSYTQAYWQYDPVSETYLRFLDDADGKGQFHPHVERLTGRQLGFENVILVLANYNIFRQMQYDVALDAGEQGFAFLFRDGLVYPIRWSMLSGDWEQKTGLQRPIRFVDADGRPFPLKPGRTWISILSAGSGLEPLGEGRWKATFVQPE